MSVVNIRYDRVASPMTRNDPLPVGGVSEVALLCGDESELRACTEFYCETLGFPLVTVWRPREESNYGETVENLDEVTIADIEGHECWVKAGRTLLGLWLPQDLPENADRPPSEWEDVWDVGGKHVHYALEVRNEDFERLEAELVHREVDHKRVEHSAYGGARSIFVRDPAGHVLEFAERRLRSEVEDEMPDGANQ